VISATAFVGVGLLFSGILPPFLNHEINVSRDAVPLPMNPLDFSALHIVEALLNDGDPRLL
jgi:hypothetical protein